MIKKEESTRTVIDLPGSKGTKQDRRTALSQARGIWQNRDDLPALPELREEMNRNRSRTLS